MLPPQVLEAGWLVELQQDSLAVQQHLCASQWALLSAAHWQHLVRDFFKRQTMKKLSRSEFSLNLIQPPSNEAIPTSEVVIKGVPSGKVVDGAVLEAAVEWVDLILAFLTDDILHENFLHIYLFDQALNVIDSARLGAMYSTGVFSDLVLHPPDEVAFEFIGGITWKLKLLHAPQFAVPFISDPTGVSRPFGFHRRFLVIGKPLPDDSYARKKR